MERRSWPWKRRSSDKVAGGAGSTAPSLTNSGQHKEQDVSKNTTFVQITLEAYTKLTESEKQVKILNEKLSSVLVDLATKDNLVKQQSKVAEEAVSGWEKAEAEALSLKKQLESLTLQKLASDDQASHLDGALKECMMQIRLIKEESQQQMQELVISKTKQWEKVKFDLEAKMLSLEQELLGSLSENDALARSLKERYNLIMKMKEEKCQDDAEISNLRANIQSCEKEISSLKYELHLLLKELQVRNEEKDMSIRSAEAANKHHLESIKKIAKLEAECQRLRGLIQKKLPGPAALAQMKLEVEKLCRDSGEHGSQQSPVGNLIPCPPSVPEFPPDIAQNGHKETEFLTSRLLAMEEETKMLKEALAKRNIELQAARSMCAKTRSKLQNVEAQLLSLTHGRNLERSNVEMPTEGSVDQSSSSPPSLTSMSEDGGDDEASCAESCATTQFLNGKVTDRGHKLGNSVKLELMDDFLEMEKLSCKVTDSNRTVCRENNLPYSASRHQITGIEVKSAVSKIHSFILSLAEETERRWKDCISDGSISKIGEFSGSVDKTLSDKLSMSEFILDLAHVLTETSDLYFSVPRSVFSLKETNGGSGTDNSSSPTHHTVTSNGTTGSQFTSGFDCTQQGLSDDGSEIKGSLCKCLGEEIAQLKIYKDNLETDLTRCNENLEKTKAKLAETESQVSELKLQLALSQKSNCLAETQLKCMTESYKHLELHVSEFEGELNQLRAKSEKLNLELQVEQHGHQETIAKVKDLQRQHQRG